MVKLHFVFQPRRSGRRRRVVWSIHVISIIIERSRPPRRRRPLTSTQSHGLAGANQEQQEWQLDGMIGGGWGGGGRVGGGGCRLKPLASLGLPLKAAATTTMAAASRVVKQ